MEAVAVDWTAVGSSLSRAALGDVFEEMGRTPRPKDVFWASLLERRRVKVPERMVVLSDLSHVARGFRTVGRRRWASAIRESRPYILALVRTKADMRHAAFVDDLVHASAHRLMVCDFDPSRGSELKPCLSRALAAGEPTSVVDAGHSEADDCLWIEFGDGLRTAIAWGAIGVDRERYGLLPETTAPAEDLASVEVLQRDGGVFDIDSGALRALADRKHAARVTGWATRSAQALGARVRAKREARGLTQVQVAEHGGLDQALISKLERGTHRPRLDTLSRYAEALGLGVSELLA